MDSTLASASSVGANSTLVPPYEGSTLGGGVAGSIGNGAATGTGLSMTLDGSGNSSSLQQTSVQSSSQAFKKKKIKGGLTLVYDAEQTLENDDGESVTVIKSMEEHRSVCARYSKVMSICFERRRREIQLQQ